MIIDHRYDLTRKIERESQLYFYLVTVNTIFQIVYSPMATSLRCQNRGCSRFLLKLFHTVLTHKLHPLSPVFIQNFTQIIQLYMPARDSGSTQATEKKKSKGEIVGSCRQKLCGWFVNVFAWEQRSFNLSYVTVVDDQSKFKFLKNYSKIFNRF